MKNKKNKPAGLIIYFALLLGLLGRASDGWAEEWIRLYPLEWEMTSKTKGVRERIESTNITRDIETESGIRFKQKGYSLDPKIGTFSVEANPVHTKGRLRGSDGLQENRDALFLNFNAEISALHGTPGQWSVNAQASRNTGALTSSLGSTSDFRTENRRFAVNWKPMYFPSTLGFSERRMIQSFKASEDADPTERNTRLRTLRFKGRSSKTDFFVEHSWFHDDVEEEQGYLENRANLSHLFRWGRGSRLSSRWEYHDRRGFRDYQRFGVSETVDIKHTDNLKSTSALRHIVTIQTTRNTQDIATFTLSHNLYNNLITTFNVTGTSDDIGGVSTEDEYKSKLDFDYTKKILWGGTVSAGLGGGYGITDRVSSGGQLEVIDDSNSIPDTWIISLSERFIDTSTIVMTNDVVAALVNPPGTVVFTEGVDYTVVPIDGDLTEIHIIPGGPTLQVADSVFLSYKYAALPTVKYSSIPFQWKASLNFGWITLFHRASGEIENMLGGEDANALTNRRQNSTGIDLKWTLPYAKISGGAEQRFSRIRSLETHTSAFKQSVMYNITPKITLSLVANQLFSKSSNTKTDLFNGDVYIRWMPWRNLSITPHFGAWKRKERRYSTTDGSVETTKERFLTGGVKARYSLYKFDLRFDYDHNARRGDLSEREEDRFMLTVIRGSK